MRTEFERSIADPKIAITYKRKHNSPLQIRRNSHPPQLDLGILWCRLQLHPPHSWLFLALESQQPPTHSREALKQPRTWVLSKIVQSTSYRINIKYNLIIRTNFIRSHIPFLLTFLLIPICSYPIYPSQPHIGLSSYTLPEINPATTRQWVFQSTFGLCHLQVQITLGIHCFRESNRNAFIWHSRS